MPSSQIEEIKNKLDILEVVGNYVKLKKTGANYRGACPFHTEKTPSFFVSPARQMWHCFGCSEGGSIFDFIMKIEGIEFGDALRILAQKAGVELKKEDPKILTARNRLQDICELSCKFFEKQLEASQKGNKALNYLLGRGITKDSVKKWRLGYSPNTWKGLSDFLVGKGFQREEIVKAGLAVEPEKGKEPYDRFRGRIIFPVFDLNSQPVGFGARVFENAEDGGAKYINTPQTMLYDKGHLMYGLNFAKVAIRKNSACTVTEGYTDAIMAHQAGFENTVACSGTALTPYHLIILKRYTENLVLAFDMDLAGDSATKRGIDLAQEAGFNIKVIQKTEANSDPADVIKKDPKEWEKSVKEARSILDFYFDSSTAKYDKDSPDGKKNIAKMILPVVRRVQNKIEQSFWIQKLASLLKVGQEDVLEELKKVRVDVIVKEEPIKKPNNIFRVQSRKKIIEEKIISLVLKDPGNLAQIQDLSLFSDKAKELLSDFKKQEPLDKERAKKILNDLSLKYDSSSDQESKNFLGSLALRAEIDYEEDDEEEMQLCLSGLKALDVRDRLKDISEEIKKAEQDKSIEKLNDLMGQFNNLTKEL
ncbi:DNA primase [Patescibacteria group bacterium]|nr:DNA primase [Patescibacteria group bacterium]